MYIVSIMVVHGMVYGKIILFIFEGAGEGEILLMNVKAYIDGAGVVLAMGGNNNNSLHRHKWGDGGLGFKVEG